MLVRTGAKLMLEAMLVCHRETGQKEEFFVDVLISVSRERKDLFSSISSRLLLLTISKRGLTKMLCRKRKT